MLKSTKDNMLHMQVMQSLLNVHATGCICVVGVVLEVHWHVLGFAGPSVNGCM